MNRKLLGPATALMVVSLVAGACSGTAATPSPTAAAAGGASAPASAPASDARRARHADPLAQLRHRGERRRSTEALIEAFEAKNPGVTIKVVSQPADNYFDLLQAAAISKTGPDLATQWTGLFDLKYKDYLRAAQRPTSRWTSSRR